MESLDCHGFMDGYQIIQFKNDEFKELEKVKNRIREYFVRN